LPKGGQPINPIKSQKTQEVVPMKLVLVLSSLPFVLLAGCEKPLEVAGPLNIPGAIFEYSAEGSGVPCIVFTGSENIGNELYSGALKEHFLFIHADPANLGPDQLATLTLDRVTDDIERVRTALGVERIAVMGHSMFGPVPLEYALRYPERTLGSIVTGALPFTTTEALEKAAEYWDSSASEERREIREANRRELARRDQSMSSPSDIFWDQYEADVPMRFFDPDFDLTPFRQGLTTSVNMDFVNHFWGVLLREFDHRPEYGSIRTPVLVIAGRYDFGAPYFLWEGMGETIPDFTFHLFENAGHNPMLEVPVEFDRVLVDWIENKS
jgi:proline iminopeptidase